MDGKTVMVYIGERTTQQGQRRYAYVEIPEYVEGETEKKKLEWQDTDESWFGKPLQTPTRPGMVIEATWTRKDDGVCSYSTESVLGFWTDMHQVIEWDALNRATRDARAAANEDKREARRNLMSESIEPIRTAYTRASTAERQQILAAAIRYITTGG